MADITAISKDQENTQQHFKFRGVDQFINGLHPILVKHGLVPVPRCIKEQHELKEVIRSSGKPGIDKHVSLLMEYDFYAEDGSKLTVGPIPSEGLDSGDKATNKALSAAFKYMCIQTFWVPTEDVEDADKESPEIDPKDPAKAYFEAIQDEELLNFDELPPGKPSKTQTKDHGVPTKLKLKASDATHTEVMCFGSHKGRTFKDLLNYQGYLLWVRDEVKKDPTKRTESAMQMQRLVAYATQEGILK